MGSWQPAADRADPVALLEEQAASRVPELVPIRYGRMLVSAFTFYRGGAALMARDLAAAPRTGLDVQLCGDAHLSNFGMFAAPDRRSVFCVNDFDETLRGPFEWDVARLAASFEVAGRDRGFDASTRAGTVAATACAYRDAMRAMASQGWLDLWYARLDVEEEVKQFSAGASHRQRKSVRKTVAKSRTRDRLAALAKLTHLVDGELRFISAPPLIVPVEELVRDGEAERITDSVHRSLGSYRRSLQADHKELLERYRYVHLARKVVGVGSVGTRAWVILLVGRDDQDPLMLQLKEAQPSVLEPYLGASKVANHGERVVHGQRMMQAASDILLGWDRMAGIDGVERDFYVRQLWDAKGSVDVARIIPDGMLRYAKLCGRTLALAHARSGDPVAIGSYLGSSDAFDRGMVAFARTYADVNETDHARLRVAADEGRVQIADEST